MALSYAFCYMQSKINYVLINDGFFFSLSSSTPKFLLSWVKWMLVPLIKLDHRDGKGFSLRYLDL